MNIEIPVNTKAKVHIPTGVISDIKEGNMSIAKNASTEVQESNEKETVLEIGSGSYTCSSKIKR